MKLRLVVAAACLAAQAALRAERWVESASRPTAVQPGYGFMNWFLNTDRKMYPTAPARWIDNKSIDEFLRKLLAALP